MKKTTTFRSSRILVMAAALFGVAAPTVAQQGPRVHVVQRGETLWSLATQYLGDPYLWPEIYRLNTLVVEDPHWIFPGEELRLVAPDTLALGETSPVMVEPTEPAEDSLEMVEVADPDLQPQATPAPPPPPTSRGGTTVFLRQSKGPSAFTVIGRDVPRSSGRVAFYSSGFLTEEENLPWSEVIGPVGQSTLPTLRESSGAMIHEEIDILSRSGATYFVGDSLLLARVGRQVAGWGHVIIPTGIARVVAVTGRDVRAKIHVQFALVTDGQVAMPLAAFQSRVGKQVTPIENGMRGTIIGVRDLHPVQGPQDIVFIDRGRADGIVPGDVFGVFVDRRNESGERQVGLLEIVHVRERSSTGQIVDIDDLGIRRGAAVQLVGKMPSS